MSTTPELPPADAEATNYTPVDPEGTHYDSPVTPPTSWQRVRDRNLPRRFGDFELLSEIARGGMGVVYKAKELKAPHRTVALKMILGGEHASAEAFDRFRREAALTADWDHPGIVRIHEVGEIDGHAFFTMQLVEGGSLHEMVQNRGPLPPGEAATLVRQLAEAVQFAHERHVVHRDIKPHNVLLAGSSPDAKPQAAVVPKLTDFGLARTREGGLSVTGELLGTPSYMSPEQAAGKVREVSPRSEKRIPIEFADQPDLRNELLNRIEGVYARMTETAPLAMILESRGEVRLHPSREPKRKPVAQTLLYGGNRLILGDDAKVLLVVLHDLHQERLRPGTETTIRRKGCEPTGTDAVITYWPTSKLRQCWACDHQVAHPALPLALRQTMPPPSWRAKVPITPPHDPRAG